MIVCMRTYSDNDYAISSIPLALNRLFIIIHMLLLSRSESNRPRMDARVYHFKDMYNECGICAGSVLYGYFVSLSHFWASPLFSDALPVPESL